MPPAGDARPWANRTPRPGLAYGGLACASLGWASAFIVGKIALAEMTPLAVAAWRYALATALLLPFALRRGGLGAAGRALAPLAVMIAAGGVLYPWLFLLALERTSATNTALLIALNPAVTILLAPLVGERLDRRRLGGLALALAGAAAVITRGDPRGLVAAPNTGDLLALVAAACWASFNLASRPVVGRLAPSVVNCAVYGVGGLALALLGRGQEPLGQLAAASRAALGSIAVMAALSSVIAGQLFLVGVRAVGVGRAVIFVYLVPVLTAVLATALLGEPLTPWQAAGGAGVLAGVFLATRGAPRPRA
jgi:drug/metabolite transporter (DMT)-like permease